MVLSEHLKIVFLPVTLKIQKKGRFLREIRKFRELKNKIHFKIFFLRNSGEKKRK
jgi:hypothetical protein